MVKLSTPVDAGRSRFGISRTEKVLVLGSCFADNIGTKMQEAGFDVCVNPFGTLYNPVSVSNALSRLESGIPFGEQDCVPMGAGAGLVCSFSHHTSFARPTAEEFLSHANEAFAEACEFYSRCSKVIITLGTAYCFRHGDEVVSNCLKRDAREFVRERLSLKAATAVLSGMVSRAGDRKFILTVSPIRHLSGGAHGNNLSKGILLLAEEAACSAFPERAEYFPSYEILLDELRDYRFFAEDMVHPSELAVRCIWERFIDFAVPEGEREALHAAEREFRRSRHRPLH